MPTQSQRLSTDRSRFLLFISFFFFVTLFSIEEPIKMRMQIRQCVQKSIQFFFLNFNSHENIITKMFVMLKWEWTCKWSELDKKFLFVVNGRFQTCVATRNETNQRINEIDSDLSTRDDLLCSQLEWRSIGLEKRRRRLDTSVSNNKSASFQIFLLTRFWLTDCLFVLCLILRRNIHYIQYSTLVQ